MDFILLVLFLQCVVILVFGIKLREKYDIIEHKDYVIEAQLKRIKNLQGYRETPMPLAMKTGDQVRRHLEIKNKERKARKVKLRKK